MFEAVLIETAVTVDKSRPTRQGVRRDTVSPVARVLYVLMPNAYTRPVDAVSWEAETNN